LPETDLTGAVQEAERVRKEVQKRCEFVWDGQTVNLTISVGVAGFSKPPMDKAVLLEKADRALLRSKGQGKNRVEVAAE
jgi:diguanylate cyclase (GGDEF)-like protein